MTSAEDNFNCNDYREYYAQRESGELTGENASLRASEHVEKCSDCSAYLKQHEMLLQASANLPLFDVSEKLTQNILLSIETQQRKFDLLLPIGVATALIFFVLLPIDSLQGWLAWGLGLIGLAGLQQLLKSSDLSEMVS